MAAMGGKRKEEHDGDGGEISPFAGIQKSVVLREAKVQFNATNIDTAKCARTLTRIIYLLNQGVEEFAKEETTDVFFASTKLFQSADVHLRRLTYLVIKELHIGPEESLICIACLNKDMTSKVELFRANSIRVLSKIMEPSMVSGIDRFLKQAIVDRDPFIVSSTLCASQQFWKTAPTVVKGWTNEATEALASESKMVQYHALALLYQIKQHDRLAVTKMVTGLSRNALGPLAMCLQIRIIGKLLREQAQPSADLLKFLESCLHNKSYMVTYEAARAICSLEKLTAPQVQPAIYPLQEFLTSPVPAQRFAAVKTLSEVVLRHPSIVAPCHVPLEHLITDSNRSIATLAISTLLKSGVESNVDRLMKSITGFMSDISDDFKVVLVDAIKSLCLKFPVKHPMLMAFLASSLREEGGFKYKKAIVDSMLTVINTIPEAKESGLEHFCEFIEDCEFPELSIKILHVLGEKGPKTSNPAKYVRFIFNREILETASVRSAAVASLAKFGTSCPQLTDNIVVLLKRCLNDNDDEVRDRAVMYVTMLTQTSEADRAAGANVPGSTIVTPERKLARGLLSHKQTVSLASLEHSINTYLASQSNLSAPFSLSKHIIPVVEDEPPAATDKKDSKEPASSPAAAAAAAAAASRGNAAAVNPYLELINSIPELAALGRVFKSCNPVDMTESETEYVVQCVKHIFPQHIVFQYNVTNNMEDTLLSNVTVEMEADGEWEEELIVPEADIGYQKTGTVFVAFKRPKGTFASGGITCTLKFTSKETENGVASGSGSEEDYQLEEIEVFESDFMRPGNDIGLPEFKRQWDSLNENEVMKKYSLGLDNLQAAVEAVQSLLGMTTCEGSGTVADGARTHAANLTGTFFGDINVLCRAGFVLDAKHGVTLKIAVRSPQPAVNDMLTKVIR